ncbi:MAG: MarR family winged helix-turn-helix transcriptional regulator [Sulfitobacter sp.]
MSDAKSHQSSETTDQTLQRFMGYHLKRAFNVVQADLTRTLAPFELRMLTCTALLLIVDNPGISQSRLADAMDVERPNLVVIVDELEQRDLIMRERVPTDRRVYALRATLRGRRLATSAVEAVTKHEELLFQGIDKDTREQVVTALKLIRARGGKDTA